MSKYTAFFVGGLFAATLTIGLQQCAFAARLLPSYREIIVRQVANGFVVEARVQNNPYPYAEFVFTDPAMAGSAVAGLLNERIPLPKWGK